MSITNADREMHDNYSEHMTAWQRQLVDDTFTNASRSLKAYGIKCANDDRAEALIAAIARYIIQSDESVAERVRVSREAEKMRDERTLYLSESNGQMYVSDEQ